MISTKSHRRPSWHQVVWNYRHRFLDTKADGQICIRPTGSMGNQESCIYDSSIFLCSSSRLVCTSLSLVAVIEHNYELSMIKKYVFLFKWVMSFCVKWGAWPLNVITATTLETAITHLSCSHSWKSGKKQEDKCKRYMRAVQCSKRKLYLSFN